VSIRNKSGYSGVSWYKRYSKWKVTLRASGLDIFIGYFADIEEAIAARKDAELKYRAD
jgi:hypothetical protein